MATYFLDTSALAKLYVREPGTERMLALATQAGRTRLAILSLARIELYSAVHRRTRAGEISSEDCGAIIESFEEHLSSVFLVQPVNDAVLDRAVSLLLTRSLRAYDAIQLAACLTLPVEQAEGLPTFVCSDHQLLEAARAEGASVLDPTVAAD